MNFLMKATGLKSNKKGESAASPSKVSGSGSGINDYCAAPEMYFATAAGTSVTNAAAVSDDSGHTW